ncbi:DUF817 domain-containing protein [Bacillus sp. FJAT-49736]|uniref:DUF817 domain-containing protein n=1 Tax=Bacillus sp. FJAT-49736 TaxID=2833582 RepID=UPI001BCA4375|nr:DUF817 domain-containing protein [Bacillus sp. FJAT-49736]MBS4174952.1 DUF817 domain-containing protein [Bacillus sp. FJAT-49736]
MNFLKNLLAFAYHQALSCIFPLVIFLTLALSKFISIPFLHRYDFILLICILTQILLLVTKIETIDELKVICVFHVIGLLLELFKVHTGSWSYPEKAWTKIYDVPLYSGFMYASVASYMCQAWRRLDIKLYHWPPFAIVSILGFSIYLNFFTDHYIMDFRWIIKCFIIILFFKTYVTFKIRNNVFKMPLVLSFLLIGFFIWVAENISTFFGAWQYPNQSNGWHLVHLGKISSWLLLVIVSFIAVAQLKHVKARKKS